MTRPVAEYLANNVFCILKDQNDDLQRVEAREFGNWIKELPALLADTSASGHKRVVSTSSTQGFPIAQSVPASRRPSSRQASINVQGHAPGSRSRSRAPSLGPAYEVEGSELPTMFDRDLEDEGMYSRSASTNKRRKRGARKGKGSSVPISSPLSPGSPIDDTLQTLATASQSLAREISKASRSSSKHRAELPLESLEPPPPLPVIHAPPVVTKKASKWKLGFGKNSSSGEKSPVEEVPVSETNRPPMAMSATASNVTNLIMGLNPPAPSPSGIALSKAPDGDQSSSWGRGRRPKPSATPVAANTRQPSPPLIGDHSGPIDPQPNKWDRTTSPRGKSPRAQSPASTRSGRPLASSASSMVSSNWRNSTSSAMTSSSAFTSYSNNSSRSVSTQATSVSGSSWRTQGTNHSKVKKPRSPVSMFGDPATHMLPKNVKRE